MGEGMLDEGMLYEGMVDKNCSMKTIERGMFAQVLEERMFDVQVLEEGMLDKERILDRGMFAVQV